MFKVFDKNQTRQRYTEFNSVDAMLAFVNHWGDECRKRHPVLGENKVPGLFLRAILERVTKWINGEANGERCYFGHYIIERVQENAPCT
jgi:hypothetical protein